MTNAAQSPSTHDLTATRVAYFSMEIALDPDIPTYSGGLGVLAGDTLRSAADLDIRMVGVTLVHHNGYFRQKLDPHGNQSEEAEPWRPDQKARSDGAQKLCNNRGPDSLAESVAVLDSGDVGYPPSQFISSIRESRRTARGTKR